MIIRPAVVSDAQEIRRMSLELTINRDSNSRSGFVEYKTSTIEALEERISGNPFFLTAEEDGALVGFFSNFTSKDLGRLDFQDDEIAQYMLTKPSPFIYGEQLASTKRGFGVKLLEYFLSVVEQTNFGTLWGSVSHKPYRNQILINGITKRGYELTEEISVYDGLIFGIYKKELQLPVPNLNPNRCEN